MATLSMAMNSSPQKVVPQQQQQQNVFGIPQEYSSPQTKSKRQAPVQVTPSSGSGSSGSEKSNSKRRILFGGVGYVLPPPPPASVARRNARERNRVKQVNMGFAVLRQHIPPSFCSPPSRGSSKSSSSKSRNKVSKVETLKCAVEYIRSLQSLLAESDGCTSTTPDEGLFSSSGSENHSPPAIGNTGNKSFSYEHPAQVAYTIPMQQQLHPMGTSLSPSCSDSSSPTPSYGSEHSYFTSSSWDRYHERYDVYDAPDVADPSVAPSEDELLDAIAWWQDSQ